MAVQQRTRRSTRLRPGTRTTAPAGTERGRWWIEGLDAWRALAIVAVLIFHLRPATLPGGFIGVDVFFVISGFLITTLLVRELAKNGRINLPQFWVRRARRLLPALITVVLISTIGAFFAGGDLLVGIGRHVVGALTFSNNWLEIAAGTDYFAASTPNLFMNFWSLAVEEQFYLTWPILAILIMAILPRGKPRVFLLGGAAALSAIAMMALYSPGEVTRVYYGTDTHAFGLLIGAALAFAMAAPEFTFFDSPRWQRLRVPLALAGLAVVITLMLTVDGEGAFAYRGGLLIASLASACMVAALPGTPTALTRVLTIRPLEWVGHRSYGIYMWHWPAILIVDVAWPPAAPDSPSWWVSRAVALGATLTLAALSYTYVENPIRREGFRATTARVGRWLRRIPPRGRTLTGVVAASTAALFAIALISAPAESTLERSMKDAEAFLAAEPGTRSLSGGEAPPTADAEPAGEAGGAEPAADDDPAAEEEEPVLAPVDVSEVLTITPDEVYGVGDSMMYVAAPGLSRELPGMRINAESNRQWPAIREEVTRKVAVGDVGPVVVIAGGTNAGAAGGETVEETLRVLGPERRIVLVNIFSASTFVAATNEMYAALAEKYPNVEVADWHGAVTENPGHLQPDRIHPNMEGMHLWARTVTDALGRLNVRVEVPEAD